jgi:hypothetical protein
MGIPASSNSSLRISIRCVLENKEYECGLNCKGINGLSELSAESPSQPD